jgi:hypothetical protein
MKRLKVPGCVVRVASTFAQTPVPQFYQCPGRPCPAHGSVRLFRSSPFLVFFRTNVDKKRVSLKQMSVYITVRCHNEELRGTKQSDIDPGDTTLWNYNICSSPPTNGSNWPMVQTIGQWTRPTTNTNIGDWTGILANGLVHWPMEVIVVKVVVEVI